MTGEINSGYSRMIDQVQKLIRPQFESAFDKTARILRYIPENQLFLLK